MRRWRWRATGWSECGGDPTKRFDSGGIFVDITSSCPTFALSSPLRAGSFGEPGLRRCLCGRDSRSLDPGSESSGCRPFHSDSALSAFHEDLEFSRPERQVVGREPESAGRAPSRPIPPKPRQAFLLVALEGLSEDDAAKVLDIDAPTLRDLVEESGRELAAEIATDVLIIEDETFIALDLEGLVESLGHRVLGVARTHAEAVALAKAKRPGIILADIQLADGSSGLDAVNEMLRSFEVPVIFITAYPERFLTGERPEPAFLIAKPFQPSTVSAVLSQALFFERNARRRERRAS